MRHFSVITSLVACGLGLVACGGPPAPGDASTDTGSNPTRDATAGSDTGTQPTTDGGTTVPGNAPTIAGCKIFPDDNAWNADISNAAVHPNSAAFIAAMAPTTRLHPDWGNWSTDHYGIPWQTGTGAMPLVMTWTTTWGRDESDVLACPNGGGMWCYPIPSTAKIEGGPGAATGADRHVLYLDTAGAPNNCTLYELYNAQNFGAGPGWRAINGAIFHLGSNALRTEGWTSADAAGLPILPGLVRVDEVLAGQVNHAIRFTVERTAQAYIHPATHAAGETGTDLPPMGLRVRLKASFDISSFTPAAQAILRAMKKHGMLLADNGSNWYFTGDSDDRWDPLMDGILQAFNQVRGSDFEVVNTGPAIPQGN